jgi:hypothetical protein
MGSEIHMPEMDYDYPPVPLQTIFDSAKGFGLTDDEVWRTINDSLSSADGDVTIPEYLDQLTGALAERIIIKKRNVRAELS